MEEIRLYSPEQLCMFITMFDPFQRGDVFEITRINMDQVYWIMEGQL